MGRVQRCHFRLRLDEEVSALLDLLLHKRPSFNVQKLKHELNKLRQYKINSPRLHLHRLSSLSSSSSLKQSNSLINIKLIKHEGYIN